MTNRWFTIEDNKGKLFSADEVKISFEKDPHVGRMWTMSYAQLVDLQSAIEAYLGDELANLSPEVRRARSALRADPPLETSS